MSQVPFASLLVDPWQPVSMQIQRILAATAIFKRLTKTYVALNFIDLVYLSEKIDIETWVLKT